MRATQHIFRVRRQYNQWVANQTLEDYALRFTAKRARRWSANTVAMTALGATAFLALEAIGGAITLNYGFYNALLAMLTVGAVIFLTGLPISYFAARHGLDIDLLTRGAGFGYLGSTITSLIYASFTFIFFAIEAAILAMALQALFHIPVAVGYVLCALAVIPIVTHGITWISRFQLGTQPLWLALQCFALLAVAYSEAHNFSQWVQFEGTVERALTPQHGSQFDVLLFGAAASVLFAMVAQIGEQVDYLRFLPPREQTPRWRWWLALLAAGPGWIGIGIVKMLLGSLLAWLAFSRGTSAELAADPTHMYQLAFAYVVDSPTAALLLAGTMVILSQMKINVTNAYAGSIAWSNFFSRLTHSHPGRVVWLVFNVLIALLLMELGIYRALESTLGLFAIIAVSWLGTLSADLAINKSLGLSPAIIEFKRAHLYDINPVGVGSMLAASAVGLLCFFGLFGSELQALAHFITIATTFIAAPLIAWGTSGRFYIARPADALIQTSSEHRCCICENTFEHEDMSLCPAYQGPICSLCCSLDARCHDSCKPQARLARQFSAFIGTFMPPALVSLVQSRLGHFIAIFGAISLVNAILLTLVYQHVTAERAALAPLLFDTLWTLYFVLFIISGVLAWLILLSHESRVVAQEESNRQNQLLLKEIDAHQETDRALQEAKELAEAANQAKSRYLTGISHELRTPLQSILGYAQLLGRDDSIPAHRRESLAIMHRSGEHLADLIEGLLDISRIEAGRIEIRRDNVDLITLLNQLVHMFRLQAGEKAIAFNYECAAHLPRHVITDEQRLRQILINLLSNAIKYTERGSVSLRVRYRNQVAEFTITDTGIGIGDDDLARVFKPFERVRKAGLPLVAGTGLGLTIVQLLCEIMGGQISVSSTPGVGSEFKVRLMLSSSKSPPRSIPQQTPCGYEGRARSVLVVDDEPIHRVLITEFLTPLGFEVSEAGDAQACLHLLQTRRPDIFLIDMSMPGMDGLTLASVLRERGYQQPIIMVSADAQERHTHLDPEAAHNAYMVKPIRLGALLAHLATLLDLQWVYDRPGAEIFASNDYALASSNIITTDNTSADITSADITLPADPAFIELRAYADIGYAKGINSKLLQMAGSGQFDPRLIHHLQQLARDMRFESIANFLKEAS